MYFTLFLARHIMSGFPKTDFAFVIILFLARQPQVDQGLLIHEVSSSNTTTHHSR
jgi:hypothetical protein